MGASWIVGLLLCFGLPGAGFPANASCREACYQQKSAAYQRCRDIPPAKRGERNRCFQQADAALKRCLSACR
jgi:hypothetical protein